MKSLVCFLTVLLSAPMVFAGSICPRGFKTEVNCTANAVIPFYSFAAICTSDTGQAMLALDAGAATNISLFATTTTEDASSVTFKATGGETDGLQLTVAKATTNAVTKVRGVLSYKMLGEQMKDGYSCKY